MFEVKLDRRMIAGLEAGFEPHFTSDIKHLLEVALAHLNRFVRETALYTVQTICLHLKSETIIEWVKSSPLLSLIKARLCDHWPQVIYAACQATRNLSLKLSGEDHKPIILPALCMNRYHTAEGVRTAALEVWRELMQMTGPATVAKYIAAFSSHYIEQVI